MQVSVESASGLERSIRVEVPADTIEQEVESRLVKLGKTAKIKGFRPGKIPAKVVRQHYGAEVRQDVLNEVLQSSYVEALTQEELKPAGNPTIDAQPTDEGQGLVYTATFEIYPEVEVTGLDKLKLEKPTLEISEKDVTDMLDNLRKQRATWVEVERKAEEDDQVTIDFEGSLKGEVFEGGAGEDVPVVLGQKQMLEDFEKALYGVKAGEEKEFKVKFPKDYPAEELAGQKAVFKVNTKKVEARELPEIDEEFIKGFGIESGAEEDLIKDIRENMARESANKVKDVLKGQVLDQVHDANLVDVPKVMIEQEITSMRQEVMQRNGITDENEGPTRESLIEMAERRVRLSLLMSTVIEQNQIQVDSTRVTDKVDELCKPYPNADEMRDLYLQNQQLLGQIQNMILEEQLVDFLVDQGTVKEKSVGFIELMES